MPAARPRPSAERQAGEITQLLRRWGTGDREAESRLLELLSPELRKIAAHCLWHERSGSTLEPSLLVNKAFLRLVRLREVDWQDRGHFLAAAAGIMRCYVRDHGAGLAPLCPAKVLPTCSPCQTPDWELAVLVDSLLDELDEESQQRRVIVELKFFLGLSDTEAAEALNLKLPTLQREWHRARRWLFERLPAGSWNRASTKTSV
jgi:RNA polymerase sigma factor (TIGR02999 family)